MDPSQLHAVRPMSKFTLDAIDPRKTPGLVGPEDAEKARAAAELAQNVTAIALMQERLWAENSRAVLVVLQGMDTSGKDGVIRHVFGGLNPQGVHVTSFKKPSEAEADRDFLWRIHNAVPSKGTIGVFNRSQYEDVLIVRVLGLVPEAVWSGRYAMINDFERYLHETGTRVVKFMLHISSAEQLARLRARLEDPAKRWKFSVDDVAQRKHWDAYMRAYEAVLEKCSTPWAPWHVIPADKKWYRNWAVSQILRRTLEEMGPRVPEIGADIGTEIRLE